MKEGACKKPFRIVENYGIGPCIESHGRTIYLGKETLELCPEVDEEENANIFLDERTNSMSRRQIEYMDNEACVNETDSWKEMTDEEFLVGTRLSPPPTATKSHSISFYRNLAILLRIAKELNSGVVFSGVGKTKEEIKYALNKKIKQLNVESEEELEEIVEIAKVEKKK